MRLRLYLTNGSGASMTAVEEPEDAVETKDKGSNLVRQSVAAEQGQYAEDAQFSYSLPPSRKAPEFDLSRYKVTRSCQKLVLRNVP
jgi:hypothetical protein